MITFEGVLLCSFSAFICALAARKKGKRPRWAFCMGLFFGFFALGYYLFYRSNTAEWKINDSLFWMILYLMALVTVLMMNW